MTIQLSPGVAINEIDNTLIVPNLSTAVGGIAGRFNKGPMSLPILISNESELVETFGYPDGTNYPEWFTAAQFLKYNSAIYVTRAAEVGAKSATQSGASGLVFTSYEDFEEKMMYDTATSGAVSTGTYGLWASKLPGTAGNSLGVFLVDQYNWNDFVTWSKANRAAFNNTYLYTAFKQPPRTSAWLESHLDRGNGAAFTVTVTNGAVSGVTLVSGGTGYRGSYLEFNGTGSYASAQLDVANGVITKIRLTNSGNGYDSAPTVTIGRGGVGSGIEAVVTAIYDSVNKKITGFNISGGTGYVSGKATITIAAPTGLNPVTATAEIETISQGVITGVKAGTLVGGSGYGSDGSVTTAGVFSNSVMDELHALVIDTNGVISGRPGTILEVYEGLSKIVDSKNERNENNYWKTVINTKSRFVYNIKSPATATANFYDVTTPAGYTGLNWDQRLSEVIDSLKSYSAWTCFKSFARSDVTTNDFTIIKLSGGAAGSGASDGNIKAAYSLMANTDLYDISMFPTAAFSADVIKHVITEVVYSRKDALAFVSPYDIGKSNTSANAFVMIKNVTDLVAFKNINLAIADQYAQYAVMDTGWKYVEDTYNNTYRWVPLNGDVAGIVSRLNNISEPWFSPGGYDRGGIINCIKLAWNPTKAERDVMYPQGINPVVALPVGGTILYGDRTMTTKPSAFDHINVRVLFNIIEKSISRMAKYKLFEINDTFTRSDFKSKVDSYLRDIQARRGITEFLTVCDTTNNTGTVIDRNEFVADIYVKPTRSINFIALNFIATASGIEFSAVVKS